MLQHHQFFAENFHVPVINDLAKKFYDLGIRLYATTGTAEMIRTLDIEVTSVPGISSRTSCLT